MMSADSIVIPGRPTCNLSSLQQQSTVDPASGSFTAYLPPSPNTSYTDFDLPEPDLPPPIRYTQSPPESLPGSTIDHHVMIIAAGLAVGVLMLILVGMMIIHTCNQVGVMQLVFRLVHPSSLHAGSFAWSVFAACI